MEDPILTWLSGVKGDTTMSIEQNEIVFAQNAPLLENNTQTNQNTIMPPQVIYELRNTPSSGIVDQGSMHATEQIGTNIDKDPNSLHTGMNTGNGPDGQMFDGADNTGLDAPLAFEYPSLATPDMGQLQPLDFSFDSELADFDNAMFTSEPMPLLTADVEQNVPDPDPDAGKYDQKSRHKTRDDHYDLKSFMKKRKRASSGSARSRDALHKELASEKLSSNRHTLKPPVKNIGLFKRGRASSPVRRSGLPDLAFSEEDFLKSRRSGVEQETFGPTQFGNTNIVARAEQDFSNFHDEIAGDHNNERSHRTVKEFFSVNPSCTLRDDGFSHQGQAGIVPTVERPEHSQVQPHFHVSQNPFVRQFDSTDLEHLSKSDKLESRTAISLASSGNAAKKQKGNLEEQRGSLEGNVPVLKQDLFHSQAQDNSLTLFNSDMNVAEDQHGWNHFESMRNNYAQPSIEQGELYHHDLGEYATQPAPKEQDRNLMHTGIFAESFDQSVEQSLSLPFRNGGSWNRETQNSLWQPIHGGAAQQTNETMLAEIRDILRRCATAVETAASRDRTPRLDEFSGSFQPFNSGDLNIHNCVTSSLPANLAREQLAMQTQNGVYSLEATTMPDSLEVAAPENSMPFAAELYNFGLENFPLQDMPVALNGHDPNEYHYASGYHETGGPDATFLDTEQPHESFVDDAQVGYQFELFPLVPRSYDVAGDQNDGEARQWSFREDMSDNATQEELYKLETGSPPLATTEQSFGSTEHLDLSAWDDDQKQSPGTQGAAQYEQQFRPPGASLDEGEGLFQEADQHLNNFWRPHWLN